MDLESGALRLREAGLALMAAMVLADEIVADEEIVAMVRASWVLPGTPLTEADAREILESAGGHDPIALLEGVAHALTDHDRETLFNVALGIAAADGHLAAEERVVLTLIGDVLGMDVEEGLASLFDS